MRGRKRLWMVVSLGVILLALGAVGLVLALVTLTPLPTPELPVATVYYDAAGNPIGRRFAQNRIEVPLSAIPEHLRQAVIAAEDHRFYQHRGVDPRGLLRALFRNALAGRVVEGGSTITQQLARNLYLTHRRTIARKVQEAILALKLERAYTKDEILAMYLNTIYLGRGAYGVEVAAQTYLGKHVSEVNLAEAALLAGIPRGPEIFNPVVDPEAARTRRDEVLQRMVDVGYLSPTAAGAARAEPVAARPAPATGDGTEFFRDYVEAVIRERHPAIYQNLQTGGYRIYTTLDSQMQQAAVQALQQGLPGGAPNQQGVVQPQGALVAMDPQTGYIRAMVGGRDYANSNFNRAVDARRQPGSAFKPILYAALLATQYYTAGSTQVCEPVGFPGGAGRPPWRPRDFDPRKPYHNRPVAVRDAIRESDNVVAARWMDVIKPDRVISLARSLGIESELRGDLTLALGSSEVSVLELTRAFTAFANGGYRTEPEPILRIVSPDGHVLVENRPRLVKVLDERVAYILTDIMREVFRPGGTAGQLRWILGNRPAAGKTGTTEFTFDAWTVGYTPDLVATVWIGNDDDDQALPGTGATLAAPVLGNFLATALAGEPAREFPRPPGIVERQICRDSGLLATLGCSSYRELFIAGTEPTRYDPRLLPPLFGAPPATPGVPATPGETAPGVPAPGGEEAAPTPPEGGTAGESPTPGTLRFWLGPESLPFRLLPRWIFGE